MGGDENIKKKIEERLARLSEECAPYTLMSLQEKIGKLSELKGKRKELEGRLEYIDIHLLCLENMPDVAECRIVKDEIARSFLDYLKEKGDRFISTHEFLSDFSSDFISNLSSHYFGLLRTAQLITLGEADSKNPGDFMIKLTERGRTLQYSKK